MQLQNDGKIILCGLGGFSATGADFTLVTYNIDGSLDRSYGDTGVVNINFNGNDDEIWAMCLMPDGELIAAVYAIIGTNESFALARVKTDGTLDSAFGVNGKISTQILSNNDRVYAVALQPDGKIIAGGFMVKQFSK